MAKNFLGVQIEQNQMILLEVNHQSIQKFVVEEIPEGTLDQGVIVGFSVIEEILRNTMKENKIKNKNVCFVLPDSDVFVKKFSMPSITTHQLEINLPYEFKNYITEEKDAYIYDYLVTDIHKEEDTVHSVEIIGAAILISKMDKYKQMFKNAGLKLVQALPKELALSNVINTYLPQKKNHDYAILEFGYDTSTVNIYANGSFDTNRTIDQGIHTLAKTAAHLLNRDEHVAYDIVVQNTDDILNHSSLKDIYNAIAVDVMRSINYYTYENRDNNLDVLYVTGMGANIIPFIDILRETLPINVVLLSDAGTSDIARSALTYASHAIGACHNEEV